MRKVLENFALSKGKNKFDLEVQRESVTSVKCGLWMLFHMRAVAAEISWQFLGHLARRKNLVDFSFVEGNI